MQCPECHCLLETGPFQSVNVHRCSSCKGLWFEKGELEQALESMDPDIHWMKFELWERKENFQTQPQSHSCPACKETLFGLNYAETSTTVDYCASCFGIWLSPQQFEKILNALEKEIASKPLGDYLKATLTEAKEILLHPQYFMVEWKDLATLLRLLQYRVLSDHPALHKQLTNAQAENPFK